MQEISTMLLQHYIIYHLSYDSTEKPVSYSHSFLESAVPLSWPKNIREKIELNVTLCFLGSLVKPWVIQSFLTFDSIDRTLKCDHSLESC